MSITDEKLKAAIQIALGTHGIYAEKIESELIHHIKALSINGVVVPKVTLPYPYKHQLKRIDQLNQTQASLSEQLQILRNFSNKLGLYDASDYLKEK